MAQILIRNLEDSVKEQLRERAELHGVSLEEEVRNILRKSVHRIRDPEMGFGTWMAKQFEGIGVDLELPNREDDEYRPLELPE